MAKNKVAPFFWTLCSILQVCLPKYLWEFHQPVGALATVGNKLDFEVKRSKLNIMTRSEYG